MSITAPDVYAQQLFRLGYGYPLWNPEPPRGEVLVGDVGFISDGSFYRVFNATKSETDPENGFGVPDGYEPFSLTTDFSNVTRRGMLAPGALCSKTVKHLTAGAAATAHGIDVGFDFQCTDEQGAVLVLRKRTDHQAIHPSRRMANYISHDFSSWYDFITGALDVDISRDGIRFISGVHKTAEWAVASYTEEGRSARFRFNAHFPPGSVAFTAATSTTSQSPPIQNWGPESSSTRLSDATAKNDQAVFINFYKLKRRFFVFPRVVRAAAGYDELPPRPDDDPDEENLSIGGKNGEDVQKYPSIGENEVQESPSIDEAGDGLEVNEIEMSHSGFTCWDPVDIILDYILEHDQNCKMAIAHDRDINQLCEKHGCEIPEDIPLFLETIKPDIEVTEDGLGMLSHDDLSSFDLSPINERQSAPLPIGADEAADSGVPQTGEVTDSGFPSSADAVDSGGPSSDEAANPGVLSTDGAADAGIQSTGKPEVQTEDQAHGTSRTGAIPGQDALGGNTVHNDRHDTVDQKKARHLGPNGGIIELEHHTGGVTALAYSPDGRHIASGADDALVHIWDAESGLRVHKCQYHSEAVCALAFSPDGKKLVSGSGDGLAVIWDVETGQNVAILPGHLTTVYCVAYSPDGAIIATGSVDASAKIWDAASGQERWSLNGHSAIVLIIAFSLDSRRLVSASADYTARVWDLSNGETLWVLGGHQGVIYSLAFAPDNRRLVTGSDDGSARIWNTETGEELVDLRVHSGSVWSATFSPDGKQLLSAASDGSIRICDSYSGEKLHEMEPSDQLVNSTAFSADGSQICASSADNSIRVWDATTAKQLTKLYGHSDKVSHLRFSPDGTRIVSSSDDGMLRIWNLSRLCGQQVETAEVDEDE